MEASTIISSVRPFADGSGEEELPAANYIRLRRFLSLNHQETQKLVAHLQTTFRCRVLGGRHRRRLEIMLEEIMKLGEDLFGDLEDAPRHFRALRESVERQAETEDKLYGWTTETQLRKLSLPAPSVGKVCQDGEALTRTEWQEIKTKAQTYNENLRRIKALRFEGIVKQARMHVAGIPTMNRLRALPIVDEINQWIRPA